jgi:transposase
MANRKFSREVKLEAVRRLQSGESSADIARVLEIHRSDLYRWRRELEEFGDRAFRGGGQKRVEEDHTAQLERKIGQQALEIDFLKRALQRVEEERQLRALSGARSTISSKKKPKPPRR